MFFILYDYILFYCYNNMTKHFESTVISTISFGWMVYCFVMLLTFVCVLCCHIVDEWCCVVFIVCCMLYGSQKSIEVDCCILDWQPVLLLQVPTEHNFVWVDGVLFCHIVNFRMCIVLSYCWWVMLCCFHCMLYVVWFTKKHGWLLYFRLTAWFVVASKYHPILHDV